MQKHHATNLVLSSKINQDNLSIECPFLNECYKCSANREIETCPKQIWDDEQCILKIDYPDNCPMKTSNILVVRSKVIRRAHSMGKELKIVREYNDYTVWLNDDELNEIIYTGSSEDIALHEFYKKRQELRNSKASDEVIEGCADKMIIFVMAKKKS